MQQKEIIISKEHYDLLKEKYIPNIDDILKNGISNFLDVLDDIMVSTLNATDEPTLETITLEKIYDKIYNDN